MSYQPCATAAVVIISLALMLKPIYLPNLKRAFLVQTKVGTLEGIMVSPDSGYFVVYQNIHIYTTSSLDYKK